MKNKVLYLSYNGMMEALGASQVLNYLYGLSVYYEFYLISLEKENDFFNLEKKEKLQESLKQKNIHWFPLLYKRGGVKGFLPNLYNIYHCAKKILKQEKITLIHCRAYFPTIVAYTLKITNKNIKYIYDTRAFSVEERADTGNLSRKGLPYKIAKIIEKKLYINASHITILANRGKETIQNNELFKDGDKLNNITVIPTCVDLDKFTLKDISQNKKELTIGYVGNVGNWYDFDFTLQVLQAIKQKLNYKLLIFNGEDNGKQHEYIKQKLSEYDLTNYNLEKVAFSDMPTRIKEMDIAIFFIHPLFSKRASAATKLGEFFATGIPVITNAGVGDHEYYIEQYFVGKIIEKDKIYAYDFEKIMPELCTDECMKKCREVAEKYFSLSNGVKKYKEIYNNILG